MLLISIFAFIDILITLRGGSWVCPNCRAHKESVEHVLFEFASSDSRRQFLDYLK